MEPSIAEASKAQAAASERVLEKPRVRMVALTKPVTITKNGRERTVLLSAEEYSRLKRRDRRVVVAGELSERQSEAIRNAKVPDRYAQLDEEIKDWNP